ncbi:winged helix-turn-helix domain-containing protein [Patescibacteria group bacterium]|nr:winged helix-turn-helix domain-containing protein [Patescibacteria group bacterium]MBU4000072.1 winged helix-turn-helix domain-containing protein [Patescibacteria group bacterium]MBU4056364.1 winged helix-turn-helix domain-containing protein [Patescibacteria group bacterium]MBU4368831.1 winged helix-turn-helix domain-containing protein [Patescibacteria group bacterium]
MSSYKGIAYTILKETKKPLHSKKITEIAKKLLLYVFSVDQSGNVTKYSWQDLKKVQELNK